MSLRTSWVCRLGGGPYDEIAEVYKKETESIDRQSSLKTLIVP
jgi:hypothetical protein